MFNVFVFLREVVFVIIGGLRYLINWFGVRCPSTARLDGKLVIITGSNRGIGKAAAMELARRGAKVILACRNLDLANKAASEISQITGNPNVTVSHLDFSSFKSVRTFVDHILSTEVQLDILINNAGISTGKSRAITKDGLELHFQVHHLGPLLMINLLLPLMKKSPSSRIILVSSSAHRVMFKFDLDNLNSEKFYLPSLAYSKTKLANELIAKYLASELKEFGVTINTLCPGGVFTDLFRRHALFGSLGWFLEPILVRLLRTPEMGAQTIIYCAVEPSLKFISGQHFLDCQPVPASFLARNFDLAKKTYEVSQQYLDQYSNDQ